MANNTPHTISKGTPLAEPLAARLRELISQRPARHIARDLGVKQRTVERGAAGAALVPGSRLMIELGLARLDGSRNDSA